MNKLIEKLLVLDSESSWTSNDVVDRKGTQKVVERYLENILSIFMEKYPQVDYAYISARGIEPNIFKALAAIGYKVSDIPNIPTFSRNTAVSDYLNGSDDIKLFKVTNECQEFEYSFNVAEKLVLKLVGYGEFYGFLSLDSVKAGTFNESMISEIQNILPFVSRIVGDSFFTMRLRQIAAPFRSSGKKNDLDTLYKEIANRIVNGFAADGAILRIYDYESKRLIPKGISGSVTDSQNICSLLVDKDSIGEDICKSVLFDEKSQWTIGMLNDDRDSKFAGGVRISPKAERQLREMGIHSYMVLDLTSEVYELKDQRKIGTIAFFHLGRHSFSWRDLALAKSFSQRAADMIALYQRTDELEEIIESLRLQNKRLTEVEIVGLLTHDLGHKAFDACINVDEYITKSMKMLRAKERQNPQKLEKYAENAKGSTLRIQNSISQIRTLTRRQNSDLGPKEDFQLLDVIDQVEKTLTGALNRNRIDVVKNIPENIYIFGHDSVLTQIFFNLFINSIESIKIKNRSSKIHIKAKGNLSKKKKECIITFWDEGPGINRAHFPNAIDIFEFGKSSKKGGTGTGLPVSQSLLERYFSADMQLDDPETARFRITIPIV